ncbi:hypothetical protein ABZ923_40445 [Streptomyces sp. NPDC046881]|uniref:hypothetical protein n=1 Tax=Streptomyces sp. NPDC046881 TaxID=3155374 RepID=UPI0033FF21DE
MLPKTTAYRIIMDRMLPVTPEQALAFLHACYVHAPEELASWNAAGASVTADSRDQSDWVKEHARLLEKITKKSDDRSVLFLKAVS